MLRKNIDQWSEKESHRWDRLSSTSKESQKKSPFRCFIYPLNQPQVANQQQQNKN